MHALKFALILLLLLPTAGVAQKAKMRNGVLAYRDKDFAAAVKDLKAAIDEANSGGNFRDKHYAKTYSYMGRSFVNAWSMKQRGQGDNPGKVLDKYPDYPEMAYNAFAKAEQYDSDATFTERNQRFYPAIQSILNSEALSAFQNQQYDKAEKLSGYSVNMYKEMNATMGAYLAFMIQGLVQKQKDNNPAAIESFEQSRKTYQQVRNQLKKQTGGQEARNMRTVYENLVVLYMDKKDYEKALEVAREGQKLFPDYESLKELELSVYTKEESLYEEGLQQFKKELEENPENSRVRVSYARMLAKQDTMKAIEQYKKAIEHDKDNVTAIFNLGALYNNIARNYSQKANATDKDEEVAKYRKQQKKYAEMAYEKMKRANELEPNSLPTLRSLKNLAVILEKMEEAKKYREQYNQLKKEQ
jgi:tetratricopeptide (TPR) repeat protein